MTTQIEAKIEKIYEVIADKTLSFGCRISVSKFRHKSADMINKSLEGYVEFITERVEFDGTKQGIEVIGNFGDIMIIDRKYKIIGHPVMIGDVLDWIDKLNQGLGEDHIKVGNSVRHKFDTKIKIIEDKRKEKRKPIEDQSEECIEFVYSLIEEGTKI